MEGYNSEIEQVEALRKWWQENGAAVLIGIVLGLVAIAGWKGYQSHTHDVAEEAAGQYQALLDDMRGEKKAAILEKANKLAADREGTPYATLAALAAAKQLVSESKLDEAAEKLRWATEHAEPEELKFVAKVRLVRVLIAKKAFDDANKVLEGRVPVGFEADYAELRGDLNVAQGKLPDARTAYKEAISYLTEDAQRREAVEMKLNDIAG